jgi:hypothetical protein
MAQITLNSTGVASNGALVLQSNGTTTAVTVSTGQVATFANDAVVNGLTVGRGASAVATNTAVGASALAANTSGAGNSAFGDSALVVNTTGSFNAAIGRQSLSGNTTGGSNTAVGQSALLSNTTANNNTAVGYQAGYTLNGGADCVAMGRQALYSSTTGSENTALGSIALYANTTGTYNTAVGRQALQSNTTANNNTAVGYQAGYSTTTGGSNTFIGQGAGNTVTSGTQNTVIGRYNGNEGGLDIRTASNYIVLSDGSGNPRGYFGTGGNFVITRTTFSSLQAIGCYTDTTGSAANVFISSSGDFVRSTSSRKYKKDIETATHGLAELLTLRPVTYKGTGNHDSEQVLGGLIAEEVHEAGLTEFVQYAEDGSPDALAYGHMVSLCVKAIQELKTEFDAYKASHP